MPLSTSSAPPLDRAPVGQHIAPPRSDVLPARPGATRPRGSPGVPLRGSLHPMGRWRTNDDPEADDGWEESTEGDLDPDLTEEAGNLAWDEDDVASRRSWLPLLARIVLITVLLALVGSAVLPALL